MLIKDISKSSFDALVTNHFSALVFTPRSIRFRELKFSSRALATFCSLLYKKLQCLDLVKNGTYRLKPECSWQSLSYKDLNCLARVLLYDYCTFELDYGSYPTVINAYIDIIPSTPFITFCDVRKEIDVKIQSCTFYFFNGKMYPSVEAVKMAVHEVYPQTQYNTHLIF